MEVAGFNELSSAQMYHKLKLATGPEMYIGVFCLKQSKSCTVEHCTNELEVHLLISQV